MSIPEGLFPTTGAIPRGRPFVRIVEQPSKSLRYRYTSEGRPGTIPGASSTPVNKTPFMIEVVGYEGRVSVVVSCVTHKSPYRPHPHNLSGPNCKHGVCQIQARVSSDNPNIPFPKLAVQCVKRENVKEALRIRQEKNVDPFSTGFDHSNNVKSIDLNVVRLCVQVFLKDDSRSRPLTPVVSEPIYNKKTIPDPLIYRLSHCNAYVYGAKDDIILLCTRISKEDVKIRFFETQNGQDIWEDYGIFSPNHVYNHSAICFRPPVYYNQNITEPARVSVQLVRPSDGVVSPSVSFEYLPIEAEPGYLKKKRKKYDTNQLFTQLMQMSTENNEMPQSPQLQFAFDPPSYSFPADVQNFNTIMDSGDLSSVNNMNLESANVVREVLNLNYCDEIHLENIQISSGDLEMADVERLSGSFHDNLLIL